MPHTPPRTEPQDVHSAVLLGVPAPRRDPATTPGGNATLTRLRRTGHPDPEVTDRAWERISALVSGCDPLTSDQIDRLRKIMRRAA